VQQDDAVIEYANSRDALELCEHPVDLAFIDGHNPPLGGVELFKPIRQHSNMRVVFLSPSALEIREELRSQSMDVFGYFDTPCHSARSKVNVILGQPCPTP
jgi:CheY-like chemotaxis protein